MAFIRAKPRQIDVMPDIRGLLAFLHDFSFARKETSHNINLNLAHVRKVDSIGLAILIGLLFLGKNQPENYRVNISWSNLDSVNQVLKYLGLTELLNAIGFDNKKGLITDLFYAPKIQDLNKSDSNSSFLNSNDIQKIILFNPQIYSSRQNAIDSFSFSLKRYMEFDSPRTFNHEQIIKVFIELAKNTYDHSSGIGIAGMKISKGSEDKKIDFVYCDTGDGICRSVRNYLSINYKKDENLQFNHLVSKGSACDFLHQAFQAGFSTKKGNGVNHGMGLTLIAQGSAGCGFNFSLKDADSIIDFSGLEEPYTHTKLRANSSRTNAHHLLMFHIEREIKA